VDHGSGPGRKKVGARTTTDTLMLPRVRLKVVKAILHPPEKGGKPPTKRKKHKWDARATRNRVGTDKKGRVRTGCLAGWSDKRND